MLFKCGGIWKVAELFAELSVSLLKNWPKWRAFGGSVVRHSAASRRYRPCCAPSTTTTTPPWDTRPYTTNAATTITIKTSMDPLSYLRKFRHSCLEWNLHFNPQCRPRAMCWKIKRRIMCVCLNSFNWFWFGYLVLANPFIITLFRNYLFMKTSIYGHLFILNGIQWIGIKKQEFDFFVLSCPNSLKLRVEGYQLQQWRHSGKRIDACATTIVVVLCPAVFYVCLHSLLRIDELGWWNKLKIIIYGIVDLPSPFSFYLKNGTIFSFDLFDCVSNWLFLPL